MGGGRVCRSLGVVRVLMCVSGVSWKKLACIAPAARCCCIGLEAELQHAETQNPNPDPRMTRNKKGALLVFRGL